MNRPCLILPTSATKSWARLRLWCANLREATPKTDVREQAAVLCTLLDAHHALQHRNPSLADELLQTVQLAREQLALAGYRPPEI